MGTVGFGLIEVGAGLAPHVLGYGVIKTEPNSPHPQRLRVIHEDLGLLLAEHAPDVMAVEELFFFRNVTTAIPVAQARGVILLAAALVGIPVSSYTPMQVKKAVTGTGKAEKAEVQQAIRELLRLDHYPRPDDAAEALAVALTHWAFSVGQGLAVDARGCAHDRSVRRLGEVLMIATLDAPGTSS